METNRRTFGNFLRAGWSSSSQYIQIFLAGMVVLSAMFAYACYVLSRLMGKLTVADGISPQVALYLYEDIQTIAIMFISIFILIATFSGVFVMVLSHSVGGPMVALCAIIDQLKDGNYEIKRQLRRGDGLSPIYVKLRELADVLKQKQK